MQVLGKGCAASASYAQLPYGPSPCLHLSHRYDGEAGRKPCVLAQAAQLSETLSTCRFAQRMAAVAVDARRGTGGGLAALHGSLFRLDPVMQRYMEARSPRPGMLHE